ncbi:MAG TPA: threonine/serine dehydratase [Polyangiaceae bacterium]|nr:threonine/serine dehydratase [Polyangiaceae bacterium]
MIDIADIRAAAQRIAGKIHRTPLLSSSQLAGPAPVRLHLKCENFQKTGSFKARGALNKILSLNAEERGRGLVTVSAGNHAAAVAWASRIAGCSAVVVMPSDAPKSKMDAVRGYGAEIVAHPDRATLFDKLEELRAARGLTFIHPFDDAVVLAGAGTVGLEIAEDLPDVELVIVPVGGGGLLSGVASATKQMNPQVRVVAVELEAGPGLGPSLAAGRPIPVKRPDTIADGMTPPFVGALPLAIAREAVDEIVTVTEAEIIDAMRLLMTRAKLYVEGSGAAATAALLSNKVRARRGERTIALVSGGNVDLARVAAVV